MTGYHHGVSYGKYKQGEHLVDHLHINKKPLYSPMQPASIFGI